MKPLILTIVILFVATTAHAQLEDPALNALFADAYDRPYIDWCLEQVPGVQFCSVFDHDQLVEDPLIPDEWLVIRSSTKHRANPDSLQAALAAVEFAPTKEEEVMAVVQLLAMINEETVITADGMTMSQGAPAAVAEQVKAPSITQGEDFYTVDYYTYANDHIAAFFGHPASEWVRHRTLEVGRDHFNLETEQLWSSGPREGQESP